MRTAPGSDPVKLKGLKIDFLSPVTRPAHEGAVALLLKRRGDPSYKPGAKADDDAAKAKRRRRARANPCAEKRYATALKHPHADQLEGMVGTPEQVAKFDDDSPPTVITSNDEGHSHLVRIWSRAGETSYQQSEGEETSHDHPWMLTQAEDGTFSLTIGMSGGHTHTVDERALNAAFAAAALNKLFEEQEDDMPKPTITQKTEAEVQALETNLALARIFGDLDDTERGYFETLGDVGKSSFIQKSHDDRKAEISKAGGKDEVVYKAANGTSYTRDDDPRLVIMAKERDEDRAKLEKAEQERDQERLEKRANEEFGHLPGGVKAKAATLKALEAIPDEATRKAAIAAVKAGDSAIAKGFNTFGTSADDELGQGSSSAKLDSAVKAYAEKKGVSVAKAYSEFTDTPEGRELYNASLEEGPVH